MPSCFPRNRDPGALTGVAPPSRTAGASRGARRGGAALRGRLTGVLAVTWVLGGCAGPATLARPDGADARSPTVTQESFPSGTGCTVLTTRFTPQRARTRVPVVLAPGFMRSRDHLAGLARRLAGLGIPVVTLDPCNGRPWGGRPVQDALDMIRAARRTGAPAAVYGGFSAGGLRALIAGRLDPAARGVLALDLVDHQGLGAGLAPGFDRPLQALAGEPTGCNARGNGVRVIASAPRGRLTPVPGASHCDFESPTDWLCEALCDGIDSGSAARRRSIAAAASAAASDLVGLGSPRNLPDAAVQNSSAND